MYISVALHNIAINFKHKVFLLRFCLYSSLATFICMFSLSILFFLSLNCFREYLNNKLSVNFFKWSKRSLAKFLFYFAKYYIFCKVVASWVQSNVSLGLLYKKYRFLFEMCHTRLRRCLEMWYLIGRLNKQMEINKQRQYLVFRIIIALSGTTIQIFSKWTLTRFYRSDYIRIAKRICFNLNSVAQIFIYLFFILFLLRNRSTFFCFRFHRNFCTRMLTTISWISLFVLNTRKLSALL